MPSISRVADVSIKTLSARLVDTGESCAQHHDEAMRNVRSKRIQTEDIRSFCYAKAKKVQTAKAAPEEVGDAWTWSALDADSKLIVSYLISGRGAGYANDFVQDVASRPANRVQLSMKGLKANLDAVEGAFAVDVDYARLVKLYGGMPDQGRFGPVVRTGAITPLIQGRPNPAYVSTSYIERHNLTMRMSMRRFTRFTNAFSKKVDNHFYALALYFTFYNLVR